MFIAQPSVRSRAAFACCFLLIAAACSGDRKPAAPAPGAPAPNLGLVPLPALPEDTAAGLLKQFELSIPKLQQWAKAQKALNEVTDKNPRLLPDLTARTAPKTLDQMVAIVDGEPKLRAALKKTGVTAREYLLTMIATQQAMQGYQRVVEGKPLPNDLPPATAANIVFVQKNMPAIQQVLASVANSPGASAPGGRKE